MRKRTGALALALAGMVACGGDDPVSAPEDEPLAYGGGEFSQQIVSGGRVRTYLVVVPPSADPATPAPMVLVYHGRPQGVESIRAVSDMDRVAGDRGWIVVYPKAVSIQEGWAVADGLPPATTGQDDVLFTRDIVRAVGRELNVDPDRIYATGYSNGSQMVMRLACELGGDLLAAAAPVAGTMSVKVSQSCIWDDPISFVTFLGDRDNQFPWGGVNAGIDIAYSGPSTADYYAQQDGCTDQRLETELPDTADDGTTVTLWVWDECDQGTEVHFYAVFGGGHTWPGSPVTFDPAAFGRTSREIPASEIMVEFFQAHPRR